MTAFFVPTQVFVRLRVRLPVDNGISKRFSGHSPQEVCPWNVSFAAPLREPAFDARPMFFESGTRNGNRALARAFLTMETADYATAFRASAIKRAKLWMLKRNACVVLGNIGADDDEDALSAMLQHEDTVVGECASWAMARLRSSPTA